MDRDEIRRQIDAILNKHDEAFRALRDARGAIRATDRGHADAIAANRLMLDGLLKATNSLADTLDAHDRAIQAALDANQAALALLRQMNNGQS